MSVDPTSPLLGHRAVRDRLTRAAELQRLHHCLLFEGPEGVGKFTYAKLFAMELNCEAAPPSMFGGGQPVEKPCGVCDPCRWILAGSHPDVIIVQPDPEKATPVITAAQARAIVNGVQLQRHSGKRRVFILDPADALNDEAANALLKTLEEPPDHTQFILVTARPATLLQTVRSRSQRVRFGPLTVDEMATWAANRGIDPAILVTAAGSPGRAIALSGGEAATRAQALDAFCGAVGQPLHMMFSFTEAAAKSDAGAELILEVVEELLADTVRLAAGQSPVHVDRTDMLRRWVRGLWPDGVGRLQGQLALARERLALNVQDRIVLEPLLAQLNLELSQVPA